MVYKLTLTPLRITYSYFELNSRPRVHKAFQNQDQDQAQGSVNYFTMDVF